MKDCIERFYYFLRYKIACVLCGDDDVLRARISIGKRIILVNDVYIQFEDKAFIFRDNMDFTVEDMENCFLYLKK